MEGKVIFSVLIKAIEQNNPWDVWTDGEEILTESESIKDNIVKTLDALGFKDDVKWGYYDPAEDERNDEVNDHTGNYYITQLS